jgi:hypothetical protein
MPNRPEEGGKLGLAMREQSDESPACRNRLGERVLLGQLRYAQEDLLREHDGLTPHVVAGYRLHGGFDSQGRYHSPRAPGRWVAVKAWQDALARRGFPLLTADRSLLRAGPYPSYAQQKLLLRHGLGQTLWNSLTITGVIEARGSLLSQVTAPDFQSIAVEDVGETAVGHLNQGLLHAHGLDEGGDAAQGVGGHDAMWFAVRDLLFGSRRWPNPVIPSSIARPDEDRALLPLLPRGHERMILLLMNVLLIEVRAENIFGFVEALVKDPELFSENREGAARALELIGRIREDERIHVAYLRTVLSELRSFSYRTKDGKFAKGAELLDPLWRSLVGWHTVENPRLARAQQRGILEKRILEHAEGVSILQEFQALESSELSRKTPLEGAA